MAAGSVLASPTIMSEKKIPIDSDEPAPNKLGAGCQDQLAHFRPAMLANPADGIRQSAVVGDRLAIQVKILRAKIGIQPRTFQEAVPKRSLGTRKNLRPKDRRRQW